MSEVEERQTNRVVATDFNWEVAFNGVDNYQMEFLKELEEIKQLSYTTDDVKWIGRNLTDTAMVWWRIVKHDISNFTEFKERLIGKYWGAYI